MTHHPPDDVLSVPAPQFQPLRLGLEDALPVSMVLLLGYGRRLEPLALRSALEAALRAFPHLGARLHLNLHPLRAELVPGGGDVQLEWVREGQPFPGSDGSSPGSDLSQASGRPAGFGQPVGAGRTPGQAAVQALESLDQADLFTRFAPSAAATARAPLQALQAPLLQMRLTWLPGIDACVLGVMASHMALDGSGLALFLSHMTAALRGEAAPAVVHDRLRAFPASAPRDLVLPPHYREVPQLSLAMAQDQDALAATQATVFSIPLESLERLPAQSSLAEARLFLAAHLCQEVAALQPARRTAALWCNTRGLGGVPWNYTGNAGCYVHFPLEAGDTDGARSHLKRAVTRAGFAAIADTYARLKAAEAGGRYVFWEGPGDHLLSLNLVPHVRGAPDLGRGGPDYAQLLTRNVSGLRLYATPDGKRLVVEACLPPDHGAALMGSCGRLGLQVQAWHRSGPGRSTP